VGTMQETFVKLKDDIENLDITNRKVEEKYAEINIALHSMDKAIDSGSKDHMKKMTGILTKLHMQCLLLEQQRDQYFKWLVTTNCNIEITLDENGVPKIEEDNPELE